MEEIWKDIDEYEGFYKISNFGNVMNAKGLIRKPEIASGRKEVNIKLYKDGKKKNFRVSRLVAKAFIPNPENLDAVIHIDKNFLNNRYDNLKWIDTKETYFNTFRCGKKITHNGVEYPSILNFYEELKKQKIIKNVSWDAFRKRLKNWNNFEEITKIPSGKIIGHKGALTLYKYKGKEIPFSEVYKIAKEKSNISYVTLGARLRLNWSVEDAIEIPVGDSYERWKDVKGYEGIYKINRNGTIINKSGKKIIPCYNKRLNRYIYSLYKNNKRTRFSRYKLVAEHFLPNPNNFTAVVHKDKNKTNDKVTNLKWTNIEDTYFDENTNGIEIYYNNKKYKSIAKLYNYLIKAVPGAKATYCAFQKRIKNNWNITDAILTPVQKNK